MDEEKAAQTCGSLSVGPAISGLSEPKDELVADIGEETTQELAEGSVETPVLPELTDLEPPLANQPVSAPELAEAIACEATKMEAANADSKVDAEVAEAPPPPMSSPMPPPPQKPKRLAPPASSSSWHPAIVTGRMRAPIPKDRSASGRSTTAGSPRLQPPWRWRRRPARWVARLRPRG